MTAIVSKDDPGSDNTVFIMAAVVLIVVLTMTAVMLIRHRKLLTSKRSQGLSSLYSVRYTEHRTPHSGK